MGDSICNKYFWEDIKTLLNAYSVDKDYCKSDVINHVVFAFIVLVIIGGISAYLLEKKNVFVIFLLLSGLHAVYWYFKYTPVNETEPKIETFQTNIPDGNIEEVIGQQVTYPTANNPFMNVLVDEIKYNSTRPPAMSLMSNDLDDLFKTQFINDPTDVFNNTQSQRQFYTMPSTTVPNDQESYQNWLYRVPGLTCKEGGREACALATGSDGGVIPWLTNN